MCGFRCTPLDDNRAEFTLYSSEDAPQYSRILFQGLFETFLHGLNVGVTEYPPLQCICCNEFQERRAILSVVLSGRHTLFCSYCGTKLSLNAGSHDANAAGVAMIDSEADVAARRTTYESALLWLDTIRDHARKSPCCFISYAWGDSAQEEWVGRLAMDLVNAGIRVLYDRWHNPPGTSVTKFIDQITSADFVIAIGTPLYRSKYDGDNDAVVDAELRLIGTRTRQRNSVRQTVIPLLLEGEQASSFPPFLLDSVFVDCRQPAFYFARLFDLILTCNGVPFSSPGVAEARNQLN